MKGSGRCLIDVMSRLLPGGTDENDEQQSQYPVSRSRFEPSTYRIRVQISTATSTRSVKLGCVWFHLSVIILNVGCLKLQAGILPHESFYTQDYTPAIYQIIQGVRKFGTMDFPKLFLE